MQILRNKRAVITLTVMFQSVLLIVVVIFWICLPQTLRHSNSIIHLMKVLFQDQNFSSTNLGSKLHLKTLKQLEPLVIKFVHIFDELYKKVESEKPWPSQNHLGSIFDAYLALGIIESPIRAYYLK